jgi:hypothetical protein
MQGQKCTFHLYKYELDDRDEDIKEITRIIKEEYPDLISKFKNGDMLENIEETGYRSSGIHFIKKTRPDTDEFEIIEKDTQYDDYGSPPQDFVTLTDFPIGYFHPKNCEVNNMYHPENTTELYWHCDDPGLFIAIRDLNPKHVESINDKEKISIEHEIDEMQYYIIYDINDITYDKILEKELLYFYEYDIEDNVVTLYY